MYRRLKKKLDTDGKTILASRDGAVGDEGDRRGEKKRDDVRVNRAANVTRGSNSCESLRIDSREAPFADRDNPREKEGNAERQTDRQMDEEREAGRGREE